MNRITIPFKLQSGEQTPLLANTHNQHVLLTFSNEQSLSTIPEEIIKRLRLLPSGMARDAEGVPVPRYFIRELLVMPEEGPCLTINNIRLYRDPDPKVLAITLGNRVVSTYAFIPPLCLTDAANV